MKLVIILKNYCFNAQCIGMKRNIIFIRPFFRQVRTIFMSSKIGRRGIDLFDCLHQVIGKYQLEETWFSDKFNFVAYNDEMSLILNRSGVGFYGYICFDDVKLLHEMQKGWLAETGARLRIDHEM